MNGYVGMFFANAIGMSQENFISGFEGKGYRIHIPYTKKGLPKTKLDGYYIEAEFDRLRIRDTFSVKELLFQQFRATNGTLLIASSGKVKKFSKITFD